MKERLKLLARIKNRYLFAVDCLVLLLVPAAATYVRTESSASVAALATPLAVYTVIMLIFKQAVFFRLAFYSRYWAYDSTEELLVLFQAMFYAFLGEQLITFGLLFPSGILPVGFPHSIPLIDGLISTILIAGTRLTIRLAFSVAHQTRPAADAHQVLIVGAGISGAMMVKELQANPQLSLTPVAYVDDDPVKLGMRIHGVPVIGKLRDLKVILRHRRIEQVIVAMPTAPGHIVRKVLQACKEVGVQSKTIPALYEILRRGVHVNQLRDISLEDLLRRGTIKADSQRLESLVQGARVMVTGAGGSIGSEICRQLMTFHPAELILLGHGETSIFYIAKELKDMNGVLVRPIIADIRDADRMERIFAALKPDIVFHAAAHKHVGLMEANIHDAVSNNILGTRIMIQLSERYGVSRFVMISSDKAVNPTSIMGVTKRVAELVVSEAAERTGRHFVTVRFGNVLGSRGSVVPIFKQQIENGGPITVTHPDVTRYFMTIPEAVQLVLQSATMGHGGEIFVLDMGEPIKVVDLAKDLIRLNGLRDGTDIEIAFSGLLPGEKMHEELFYEGDVIEKTAHDKILMCRCHLRNGKRDQELGITTATDAVRSERFRVDTETLIEAAQQGSADIVRRVLRRIVPEYTPPESWQPVTPLPVARQAKEPSPLKVIAKA
jgi:FlaA1/EpsC-like NDP-sugar epimerase